MRKPTWRDQTTVAKGYGREHKAMRALYVKAYIPGVTCCALGGEVLTQPARLLDLAHNEDRTAVLGLACYKHNRGSAALKGNAARWGMSPGRSW